VHALADSKRWHEEGVEHWGRAVSTRLWGYSHPVVKPYAHGWSKGEHTHPVHLVITVVAGRMELLMAGQRFVVEPGDELSYPAHRVHAAKNLSEGTSEMMEGAKR